MMKTWYEPSLSQNIVEKESLFRRNAANLCRLFTIKQIEISQFICVKKANKLYIDSMGYFIFKQK